MVFNFLLLIAVAVINYLIILRLVRKATHADQQVALLTEMVDLQRRTLAAIEPNEEILEIDGVKVSKQSAPKTDEDYLREAREKASAVAA